MSGTTKYDFLGEIRLIRFVRMIIWDILVVKKHVVVVLDFELVLDFCTW